MHVCVDADAFTLLYYDNSAHALEIYGCVSVDVHVFIYTYQA